MDKYDEAKRLNEIIPAGLNKRDRPVLLTSPVLLIDQLGIRVYSPLEGEITLSQSNTLLDLGMKMEYRRR